MQVSNDMITGANTRRTKVVFGDSGNYASIGLRRALGLAHAHVLPIGWKHGRGVDTVFSRVAMNPSRTTRTFSSWDRCSRAPYGSSPATASASIVSGSSAIALKSGWNQVCPMSVGTTALAITAVTRIVCIATGR